MRTSYQTNANTHVHNSKCHASCADSSDVRTECLWKRPKNNFKIAFANTNVRIYYAHEIAYLEYITLASRFNNGLTTYDDSEINKFRINDVKPTR